MTRQRIIAIGILVALLVALEMFTPVRYLFTPLIRSGNHIEGGFYATTNGFRQWLVSTIDPDRANELSLLQEQINALTVDRATLAQLKSENEELRRTLAFKDEGSSRVTTRIIGRDPSDPSGLIRVAAGARSGVQVGAAVVDPDGFFLGEVIAAGEVVSTVRLLRSRAVNVSARVVGREGMIGLLESPDGLSLKLTQLPKNGTIEIGDAVATGAESSTVPAGLPIGVVVSVTGTAQDLWREAIISALSSPETSTVVSIIRVGHAQ